MDFQPKLKAQAESTFAGWPDGRAMRLPVAGTVARHAFLGDPAQLVKLYDRNGDAGLDAVEATHLRVGGRAFALADANGNQLLDTAEVAAFAQIYKHKNADGTFVDRNPLPRDMATLSRGRQVFEINCGVCHGRAGTGGIVKSRWPVKIPSLVNDEDATTRARLAGMPPGEIVDVITNGKGTMPSYAQQVRMQDRWAVAHYLKALQQHFTP
jgi:mono/diheme cytochrome c family protein